MSELGPGATRSQWLWIATAFLAVSVIATIVYATFDMRRDHNQISRIGEECQRAHSDARKISECSVDLALRHARQPQLPAPRRQSRHAKCQVCGKVMVAGTTQLGFGPTL